MNKRKVPKIRFKGFHDDWEQRKLEDLCELITKQTGFDYSASIKPSLVTERQDDTYPFIQNKDFNGNDINMNTDFYIPVDVAEGFPKILLDKPSVLISISGRIGNVGFYRLPEKAFIGGAVGICKLKNPNDGEFIIHELESDYGQKYFQSLIKASSHANITVEDIRNIKLIFPQNDGERKQISVFLNRLDQLITLHQRKLEKLKIIKKSMLENCFPKNGEKAPKIRFTGFSDDWEQRKVGDFLTISKIPGHTGVDARKLTVKLWGKGVVEKTDIFGGSKNTQYYVRHAGQFMYGKLDFLHAAFGIVPKNLDNYESTLDSPAFDLHGVDSQFLIERVTQENFYLRNGMIANGSRKAKRIHEDTFLGMDLIVPTLAEQKQIGDSFRNLDHLITLHQSKLEKLKMIKKSMLETMFV